MSAFDKKKTVTDLQIIDLLEKDYAIRQAKFTSWYQSGGDMGLFNESYFWWKKSFRGFYSETYLARSGFLPSTDTTREEIDDVELLIYLQTINSDISSITYWKKGEPIPQNIARLYIQDIGYNYSNNENILITNVEYEPGEFRDEFHTIMSAVYTDETEVDIEITFAGGYYINDVPPVDPEDPVIGEEIPIPNIVETITNDYLNLECITARVEYTSDPSPEWFIYIEDFSELPAEVYVSVQLVMTAIIPIKEGNVFTKEDIYMKRFLNKMGLGGRDLVDSLTTTEEGAPSPVDNAYLIEGLPFSSTYQPVIKTLFNSFKYLSETNTSSSVNLSMAALNMKYQFKVDIQTVVGDMARGVDDKNRPIYAWSEITEPEEPPADPDYPPELLPPFNSGPDSILTIEYQIESGEYFIMTVTDYEQSYEILSEGQIRKFISYLNSEEDVGRLLIPLDVLNDLSFNDYVPVHEHSFSMIAYAIETTTIKWYERIAGFVLGIILGVIFGPAGMTLYQLILNAVINAVIGLAISFVLAGIDNPWVQAIVGIVMALYGQVGSFDLSSLTAENFLPLATKVIDGASSIYADYIKEEMKKVKEEAEEQAKKDKEMMDELKPGVDVVALLQSTMYSFLETTNADMWIENQLGDNMYNFEQYYDIEKEVNIRKTVMSG